MPLRGRLVTGYDYALIGVIAALVLAYIVIVATGGPYA